MATYVYKMDSSKKEGTLGRKEMFFCEKYRSALVLDAEAELASALSESRDFCLDTFDSFHAFNILNPDKQLTIVVWEFNAVIIREALAVALGVNDEDVEVVFND